VRTRLQVEHAPGLSVRAQIIKIADKISNLRGILYSLPANWDWQRKREYFDWGKEVVDCMTAPNPELKSEFDAVCQKFEERVRE
jgi:guanosine-3',5'-bis(diphosphate) 3'-pyrophosphohydrolase